MTDLVAAQRYSHALVARIVGARDADDVLQNAALKAWRFRNRWRREASYNTWFMRIAINEALMHKRKRQLTCVGIDFDRRVGVSRTPEALAAEAERNERLYAAILELSPSRKRAALRCLAEIPTKNSADKAARHKMREKLRELLG